MSSKDPARSGEPGSPSDAPPPLPKFLEQAWQQYLAVRQTFIRDVSIAGVAVLLLTVTFFRSVELLERITNMELDQDALVTDQNTKERDFENTQRLLEQALVNAEDQLDSLVTVMPCLVSGQLLALQHGIQDAGMRTQEPLPEMTDSIQTCFERIGAPLPEFNLSEEELQFLTAEEDPERGASAFFNNRVVGALNSELRGIKESQFNQPIEIASNNLIRVIRAQRDDLRREGQGGELTSKLFDASWELEDAIAKLILLEFSLTSPTVALTEGTPTGVPEPVKIWPYDENYNTTIVLKVTSQLGPQLKTIHNQIYDPEEGIFEKFTQLEYVMGLAADSRTGRLDSALSSMKQEVEAMSDDYTDPLPGAVTLHPRDATNFFPLIVTIVLAYFSLRYLQIKERGKALTEEFMRNGFTESQVDLYLTGPTRAAPTAKALGTLPARAVILGAIGIALLPGFLVVITAAAIVQSVPWGPGNTWLYGMYGFSLLLLTGTYCLFVAEYFTEKSPATWMRGILGAPVDGAASPERDDAEPVTHQQSRPVDLMSRGKSMLPILCVILAATVAFVAIGSTSNELGQRLNAEPVVGSKLTIGQPVPDTSLQAFNARQSSTPEASQVTLLGVQAEPAAMHANVPEDTLGVEIPVDIRTEGIVGERLDLRWSVFDATNTLGCQTSWLRNQSAPSFFPSDRSSTQSTAFWIQNPPVSGTYYVLVEILEGGVVLAKEESAAFYVPDDPAIEGRIPADTKGEATPAATSAAGQPNDQGC